MVLNFLAVENFDFTRKIVKKKIGWKIRENVVVFDNWIFGQKIDFSNSVTIQNVLVKMSNFFWFKKNRQFEGRA